MERESQPCLKLSLEKIKNGYTGKAQNHELATYFGKRIPEMGYIDFAKNSEAVINFIRAQSRPYPGAYYYLSDGRKIIIHKARVCSLEDFQNLEIGSIKKIKDGYIAKSLNDLILFEDYEIIP